MTASSENAATTKSHIFLRGIRGRCPKCGEGKLFKSYLKPVEACAHCGEPIGHIRADDGPAWLSVFLTCHIIAPFLGYFALHDVMPLWLSASILLLLTLVTALVLLPPSKGLFIAILWLTARKSKV